MHVRTFTSVGLRLTIEPKPDSKDLHIYKCIVHLTFLRSTRRQTFVTVGRVYMYTQ